MRRSVAAFLPLAVWAAAVLTIGAVDFGSFSVPTGSDKVVHFVMYGVGGALAAWAGRKQGSARAAWLALLLVLLTGIADELRQVELPNRNADFMDWVADGAGAVLVFLVIDRLLKRE